MSEPNDPRVLFAAERTLLAWNRTSLALMAFGFMIERFAVFLQVLAPAQADRAGQGLAMAMALSFVILGGVLSVLSVIQHRRVVRRLGPAEIPAGYWTWLPMASSLVLALLSVLLAVDLFYAVHGFGGG